MLLDPLHLYVEKCVVSTNLTEMCRHVNYSVAETDRLSILGRVITLAEK